MIVFVIALVVVAAGFAAALFFGFIGGRMEPATHTSPYEPPTEDRALRPSDIDALRFDQTLRGYRMGQVDQVLDRLKQEIADRDALIADYERRVHQTSYDSLTGPFARPVDPPPHPER